MALLWLIAFVGWIIGIIGFFRAGAVQQEVGALRREVERQRATASQQATEPGSPWSVPNDSAGPAAVPDTTPQPAAPAAAESIDGQPDAGEHPAGTEQPGIVPAPQGQDLEALLTLRWGVWLGALALMLAGVFLVRYAADQGLLGPGPRCVAAGLLGLALIVAAEFVRRWDMIGPVSTDQAAPGLAAGGVAVLFAAAYGAGVLYTLLSPQAAFVLLAVASLTGLALSLRHGQLVGAIGMIGAFVTPALVPTPNPSLPGLFLYLLFVTAASLGVVRYTAWIWLGWGSTIAAAVWVLLAILGGVADQAWAPALFVPAAATLNLVLLPRQALDHDVGRYLVWVPVAALGASGLLLALVHPDWSPRAGVLLLTPITIAAAAYEPRLRLLPYLAALLFLLLLAGWPLGIHDWPMVAATHAGGPAGAVQPMEDTAAFIAGCFAASGLWFERRAPKPMAWSALAASVPVLALAVCYARIADFSPRLSWGVAALVLAAGLTAAAATALRQRGQWAAGDADARAHAGAHAAGAVAALALGCAMMLQEHWLTMALSLLLPSLAWIEAQVELPALRRVALAVAAVALFRLLVNGYVLRYAFDGWPLYDGYLAAYGVPAAAFGLAAAWFHRSRDDATVTTLEVSCVAIITALVSLEIRDATASAMIGPALHFGEAALHVSALGILALATLRIASWLDRAALYHAGRVLGACALAGGGLLILFNPFVTGAAVGPRPVIDWLLPAYLIPAVLAAVARRLPAARDPAHLRLVLAGYALVAGFTWLTLAVRHAFHPSGVTMRTASVTDPELWAWSGAWLAYGAALMAGGILTVSKPLRLAGLAMIALTAAKVFLVDMSGLVGLWRVVSFLGLGVTLIGLAAVYRRFVATRGVPG